MTTKLTLAQRLQRFIAIGIGKLPPAILAPIAGAPTNQAGDTMAPEIAVLMKAIAAGTDYSDHDALTARAMVDQDTAIFADVVPSLRVVEKVDLPGGLHAVRFRSAENPVGLLLYFHGGGFVLGDVQSYDVPARLLASHSGLDVLAVDYRLAPEYPYPAAHEDALTAWEYAVDRAPGWGIDPDRIAVGGDSAGGSVAAVLAQTLRDRGDARQPALQALLYPSTDLAAQYDSVREFADSPALSAKQIGWFLDQYAPADVDRTHPRISPLRAASFDGLPPAVVTVAGFDPLRDEGVAYAQRLADAGVQVRLLREDRLVHGFISFTALSKTSAAATERFGQAVGQCLRSVTSHGTPS